MTNVYFPDEQISKDDLYFVCYMIERIARQLKQPNKYVVNMIGHDELAKKLSLADIRPPNQTLRPGGSLHVAYLQVTIS